MCRLATVISFSIVNQAISRANPGKGIFELYHMVFKSPPEDEQKVHPLISQSQRLAFPFSMAELFSALSLKKE